MLKKEIFDCNKIGDFYDCGCGHDDDESEGRRNDEIEDEERTKGTGDAQKVEDTVLEPTRVEINDEP